MPAGVAASFGKLLVAGGRGKGKKAAREACVVVLMSKDHGVSWDRTRERLRIRGQSVDGDHRREKGNSSSLLQKRGPHLLRRKRVTLS